MKKNIFCTSRKLYLGLDLTRLVLKLFFSPPSALGFLLKIIISEQYVNKDEDNLSISPFKNRKMGAISLEHGLSNPACTHKIWITRIK